MIDVLSKHLRLGTFHRSFDGFARTFWTLDSELQLRELPICGLPTYYAYYDIIHIDFFSYPSSSGVGAFPSYAQADLPPFRPSRLRDLPSPPPT